MQELNKQELFEIEGGNPLVIIGLIIAYASLQESILEHCYELGKDQDFIMKQSVIIVNLIIIIVIFILTIFDSLFPTIVLSVGKVPMMHNPYPVSIASIIKNILLVIFMLMNIFFLWKNKK